MPGREGKNFETHLKAKNREAEKGLKMHFGSKPPGYIMSSNILFLCQIFMLSQNMVILVSLSTVSYFVFGSFHWFALVALFVLN